MDITVYLPDDVAQRAKSGNVNLSRVLRDALTTQFAEEDAVKATLEEASTVTLDLRTDEGRAYRGRMEAALLGEDAATGTAVYLRRNGTVITYRAEEQAFRSVEDPAVELAALLPIDRYVAAMDALGIVPEIDLDATPDAMPGAASTGVGTTRPASRTTGRRLRSVPGDIVEPPVAFLKRLTGHGDIARDSVVVTDAPASTRRAGVTDTAASPEPEAALETETQPELEASTETEGSAI